MTTLKAFKYRIYPTKQQQVLLNKTFGCVRVIWNHNTKQEDLMKIIAILREFKRLLITKFLLL